MLLLLEQPPSSGTDQLTAFFGEHSRDQGQEHRHFVYQGPRDADNMSIELDPEVPEIMSSKAEDVFQLPDTIYYQDFRSHKHSLTIQEIKTV